MAIYPDCDLVYQMFQEFQDRCLVEDGSILWQDRKIWTLQHIQDFMRRFIEGGIAGSDRSFEEKLEIQLQDARPEIWGLVADLYYVYFLPSVFIKPGTKYASVQWAAGKAGFDLPEQSSLIWQAQSQGFTRTSLKYHIKYPQFRLLCEFAIEVKTNENRKAILSDSGSLQRLLDKTLENITDKGARAYDMRHAILHMAFPNQYERIISTRDKERIVTKFSEDLGLSPVDDIDEALQIIRSKIAPQYSHQEQPFDFYDQLKGEWRPKQQPEIREISMQEKAMARPLSIDPDLEQTLKTLEQSKNVILFGPPGTGKTYIVKKAAENLVGNQLQKALSRPAQLQKAIELLTFHEVLALSIFLSDKTTSKEQKFSVPEIAQQELVDARFKVSPVKNPHNMIWGTLQTHTHPDSQTVKITRRAPPYLFDKDELSNWKLTTEGLDYVTTNLSEQINFLGKKEQSETGIEDYVSWVTFHQSYAYEDFVEGLRPVVTEEQPEGIAYRIVPGAFREICARAAQDRGNNYVLVIDEINRGNIAKILGELITLLEEDKRAGQPNEITVRLPYSQEQFRVPPNLYIIGTMNTADRSIALLDVALRRRFTFVEIMPRADLLEGTLVEAEDVSIKLDKLLTNLNEFIEKNIDRDHQIGHSYFMKISSVTESKRIEQLIYVWRYQIHPLLDEYFYRQREKLDQLFMPSTDQEAQRDYLSNIESDEDLIAALSLLSQG